MVPTCAEAGVIGAVTGVIGTLMAMEVIKVITGAGEPLVGRLRFMTVSRRGSTRSATSGRHPLPLWERKENQHLSFS